MTAPAPRAGEDTDRGPVAAALVVALGGGLPVLLTGALGVQMSRDLGFGVAALGGAVAAYSGAATLGAATLGGLADRRGWRRGLVVASVLLMVSLLGTAVLARSWLALASLLAVGGVGHALGLPAGNLAIAEAVPVARRALILGVRQAGVPAAGLLAGLSVPLLATTVGWRWAFVAGLAAPGIVLALCLGGSGDPASAAAAPRARLGVHRPGVPFGVFVVAPFIAAGLVNATSAFVVTGLVEDGFSIAAAGIAFMVGNLIGMVTRATMGVFVSRRGGSGFVPLAVLLALGAAGFALLAVGGHLAAVAGLVLTFAGATGWPGLSHFIAVSRNPERVGAASGVMMTASFLGGTVGPLGFGILAQRAGLATAWLACAVGSGVAAAFVLLSRALYARAEGAPPSNHHHRMPEALVPDPTTTGARDDQ